MAAKRSTQNKKSKQNSVLAKLKSTFNPSSPRGRLFVFMAVFAVLGGGYMTYKSFAATPTETVYTADKMALSGNASRTTETAGSKKNLQVIRLKPASGNTVKGLAQSSSNGSYNIPLPSGTTAVRTCAYVKRLGVASFTIHANGSGQYPSTHYKSFGNMSASSDYIKVCTGYVKTYGVAKNFVIKLESNSGAEIRLSSFILDWY